NGTMNCAIRCIGNLSVGTTANA
ncbi:hypothetical protein MGSAQ_001784, partial [marine sediment metagenome]